MKRLLMLSLLLATAFAASVSITPNYVRMPVGSNHSLTINLEGEGKVYELKLYGSYLGWQRQKVWAGPNGKSLQVVFSPRQAGDYTVTAEVDGVQSVATIQVYERKESDIPARIEGIRSLTDNPAVLELVDEAEALYNQSRVELAGMKLSEAESLLEQAPREGPSNLPRYFLVAVMAVVAVMAAKVLLG